MLEVGAERELMSIVPDKCASCKTSSQLCRLLASKVWEGIINMDEAKVQLTTDLDENCRGEFDKSSGWANTEKACGNKGTGLVTELRAQQTSLSPGELR